MATAGKLAEGIRWERTLNSPETLADDLGSVGEYVGPRTGPNKRAHGEKEDYVLRRLLAAMARVGRLAFPVTVRAEGEREGEPDFLLDLGTGETLGIEITEAGEEIYQEWLTRTETKRESGILVSPPHDGDIQMFPAPAEFARVIRLKCEKFDKGKYRGPAACDLAVYNNTAWGGLLDKREMVGRLRCEDGLGGRFGAVHLVFESHVVLDALGPAMQIIDISKLHEIDFAAWLFDQADCLKRGEWSGVDAGHLAEELETLARKDHRALESHLEIRLVHMLKWDCQPEKRTRSWFASLSNLLREMENLIAANPSLKREEYLKGLLATTYPKARKRALAQARLPAEAVPESCPFAIEQIFDPEFPGLEPEED